MDMRKRGWSIASNNEVHANEDESRLRRSRSMTDHSEDTLTAAEKFQLLQSFPTQREMGFMGGEDNDDDDDQDEEEEDQYVPMTDDNSYNHSTFSESSPVAKKRKLNVVDDEKEQEENEKDQQHKEPIHQNDTANNDKSDVSSNPSLLEHAKTRLSKWAARLFDPNRPKGLIEPPTIIPLNDEFLQQFGRREKALDEAIGRVINIDTSNLDHRDDDDPNESSGDENSDQNLQRGIKVRISNLAYTTSKIRLTMECEQFGPLLYVNLLMDEKNTSKNLSIGRAYVTFQSQEDGIRFVEEMDKKTLDGRVLNISIASDSAKRLKINQSSLGGNANTTNNSSKNTSSNLTSSSRYWDQDDISIKCFKCGRVGHMSDKCTYKAIEKPCPLCAKKGHESRACPLSKICFNCGVPGHINRECPERRGMPKRMVCGSCFVSGHHHWTCTERIYNIPSYNAKCFVCNTRGHFMCSEMRWFFGLKGLFCFNCGQSGHHGGDCKRPTIDVLCRNIDFTLKEIERAETTSIAEELEAQMQKSRQSNIVNNNNDNNNNNNNNNRSRERNRQNYENESNRMRAKSQPPPTDYRPISRHSNYGKINMADGKRNGGGPHHRNDSGYR